MATGTFYIRPSADISLGHPVYPTTLSAGYLAINEKESDGASTYIGITSNSGSYVTYSSSFKMSLDDNVKITEVLSATFKYNGSVNSTTNSTGNSAEDQDHSQCICTVLVSGTNVFDRRHYDWWEEGTIRDNLTDADMPDLVAALNNYINTNGSFPDIQLNVTNIAQPDNGTKEKGYSYVTTISIALTCNYIPILPYVKKEGTWYTPKFGSSYKKVNGSWIKKTDDECRNYITSKMIIDKCAYRGHLEKNLPNTGLPCDGTAMTGGIYCSFCGKTLKEHDTALPTVDHDYLADGLCRYDCNTTSPDRVSFTVAYGSNNTANTYYAMPNVTWQDLADARNYKKDNGLSCYFLSGTDINGVSNVRLYAGFYIQNDGSVAYISTKINLGGGPSTEYIQFIVDGVTATDVVIANNAYTGTVPA